MKTRLLGSILMLVCAMAYSQAKPPAEAEKKTSDASNEKMKKIMPTIEMGPSQIEGKRVVYGGLLVNLAKTDRPIRMLSPFGPSPAGSVTNNLAVDPISGKAEGVRLFTISFKKW